MIEAIGKDGEAGHVITGGHIDWFAMRSLQGRLELEIKGIKFRGGSTYALIKRRYGLKGSRQSVLDQFTELVKERAEEANRND